MNNVVIPAVARKAIQDRGDIFLSEERAYILTNIGTDWVAISLADGNKWNALNSDKSMAVYGLTPLGRDATITIS